MEENNNLNFECEPVQEPQPEQPVYQPLYQPQQPPRKQKKGSTTAKIVALIAVVAVLGSIGGSLLTTAISAITGREEEPDTVVQEPPVQEQAEESRPLSGWSISSRRSLPPTIPESL